MAAIERAVTHKRFSTFMLTYLGVRGKSFTQIFFHYIFLCDTADSFVHTETEGPWGPFYWHGLILIPTCNHIPGKVWHIFYLFPNFNGCTVEVWNVYVISSQTLNGCNYLSTLGLNLIHVSKRGPWLRYMYPQLQFSQSHFGHVPYFQLRRTACIQGLIPRPSRRFHSPSSNDALQGWLVIPACGVYCLIKT